MLLDYKLTRHSDRQRPRAGAAGGQGIDEATTGNGSRHSLCLMICVISFLARASAGCLRPVRPRRPSGSAHALPPPNVPESGHPGGAEARACVRCVDWHQTWNAEAPNALTGKRQRKQREAASSTSDEVSKLTSDDETDTSSDETRV